MCGIAGVLSWDRPPEIEPLRAMTHALRHRGPDAEGVVARGPVALGHRRLSIIDVSSSSNQPMHDDSGRFWIVFNGEIYNYRELRQELVSSGAEFLTRSDTEVILEAYKHWGDGCTERLNGMFAFAIWDESQRRLFLARDRLGKKPLYYHRLGDRGVVFASELKSLRLHPAIAGTVNPTALGHYLSLNYTLTSACIL
ncbi:MAG TPA: asparagine synthetase B, partial [Chloroflexi bacterium]|nr:asparagine synthetase B [Chloroflexota bacterium]